MRRVEVQLGSAIPDVIKGVERGFLLESNDPKHIAIKIIELLSKNAYEYVRENFGYNKTLETWRKILSELQPNNK